MCVANMEFQLINPTTQVALFAVCTGNCTNVRNITWNIYQGETNTSGNITQWMLSSQLGQQQNIWFFGRRIFSSSKNVLIDILGRYTSNFTVTNKLFSSNTTISHWRFEVVYSFVSGKSTSALDFIINQPPSNGSCSISSLNGTTSTLFTILCVDWFDENGIKDYSLYSKGFFLFR